MDRKVAIPMAVAAILSAPTVTLADVRVIHASPDAPNVDVIVNDNFGAPLFSNAPYRGVTDYAPVPTGTYNVKVVPAGAQAPIVINADLTIDGALDYSVAASNTLASISPLVFVDDNTLNPASARVRFIHLSPNAPNVDIAVAGGGPTLWSDVQFTENGGYIDVAPGSYDLNVLVAGTSTIALPVNGLSVSANTVYTVYAMGLLGSTATPLEAIVSIDAVPEPASLALLGLGGLLMLRRRS